MNGRTRTGRTGSSRSRTRTFPKKALWAIDEGACRDWEMGKDMSKWERKYAPKKEVKIAPEPEEKEDISKLSHYERRKRAIQAGHDLGQAGP